MSIFTFLAFAILTVVPGFTAPQSTKTSAYTVSYIEVLPSARATTLAALKQYRDTSRKDQGFMRMEFFEQVGRPAHFAIIDMWSDQKSSDAHAAAAHTKAYREKLQPMLGSPLD